MVSLCSICMCVNRCFPTVVGQIPGSFWCVVLMVFSGGQRTCEVDERGMMD